MIAEASQTGLALPWGDGVGRDRGRMEWREGGIWTKKGGGMQGRGSSVAQAAFGELTIGLCFKNENGRCALRLG